MSTRVVAGAEDIPLADLQHGHGNNAPLPIAPDEAPPPYTTAATLPPDYNHPNSPPPSFSPKTTSKWHQNRRLYILSAILLAAIIIAAALGKTLSDRKTRSENVLPKSWSPNDPSFAKIAGLAAAECEAGTFVVWKVADGNFWWKGVLKNGGSEIPFQKVDQEKLKTNYTQPGLVDITATCWETGWPGSGQIELQFIYYERDIYQSFISTNIVITLPLANGDNRMPTISPSTITVLDRSLYLPDRSKYYSATSFAVAATRGTLESPDPARIHLVYLVPRDLSKPNGTANVVWRTSTGDMWGWTQPRILNATAMNPKAGIVNATAMDATAGIAIASVDGGLENGNATSLHVVFGGVDGRLMYMNWTESEDWSLAIDIRTDSGVRFRTPSSRYTLANPSTFTALLPYAPSSPFSKPHLNLYYITSTAPSNPASMYDPPAKINCVSIAYDASTGVGIAWNVRTLNVATPVSNPGYIATAAYDPSFSRNTTIDQSNNTTTTIDLTTLPNNQTNLTIHSQNNNTWSDRVQLFFVEPDVNDSQGGRIANFTFQRAAEGWDWKADQPVLSDLSSLS